MKNKTHYCIFCYLPLEYTSLGICDLNCSKCQNKLINVEYNMFKQNLAFCFITFKYGEKDFYYRICLTDSVEYNKNTSQLVDMENEDNDIFKFNDVIYNPKNIQELISKIPTILNFQ